MKTIIDYLDAAKAITGSDNKTAKALGITQGHLNNFRRGQSISDDLCLKLADLLDVDPLEVIAAKNAERTKSPEMRKRWQDIFKSIAATLLLAAGISAPVPEASAADLARSELNNNNYYAQFMTWLLGLLRPPREALPA